MGYAASEIIRLSTLELKVHDLQPGSCTLLAIPYSRGAPTEFEAWNGQIVQGCPDAQYAFINSLLLRLSSITLQT